MKLNLTGKIALITGASKGIGEATARVLAEEGCRLHLAARNGEAMRELQRELIAEYAVPVTVHEKDLSSTSAMESLADEVGPVDILINNAGDIPAGALDILDDSAWRAGFDLKVFGYITLCRLYYPQMKLNGGVIINVIGNSGENWDASYIAGSTGNAALMSFTKALGGRSLDDGIRVIGINPGPVATDRMLKIMKRKAIDMLGDEARWQELFACYPAGRPASAEEVADLVAFMSSDKAGYISGTNITIDGGIAARGSVI
ncbi:SDR family oxidoreductase [Affinibrenneria salicis]|uniref:SDR family oxidoreductase n=1 Tax=Affinibrenneria salicis TaxID=2590031 RepID=A0A5J5FQ93_9GAMM|nr:SDR family oxidoreductase [Affinibrenneria salicis]KAA8994995.1 SDR family oxidoreductase [Affinibrenneria salicis]